MKKFNKINKIFLCLLLSAVFLVNTVPSAYAASDIEIAAKAAILVDADTGKILYKQNENEKLYIASLTKIMTALVAIKAYDEGRVGINDIVTMGSDIYFDITPDGSSAGLTAGEEMTFENLLYCMLLSSANEACNAVAEFISGDVQSFIDDMNELAVTLGCKNTHFANTHGMPNEDHYSSAYDLYLIANAAMSYPLFSKIVSTDKYTVPATNLSDERSLVNTNNLIKESSTYYYEYAKGIKTGYTDAAGFCLASVAQKEDLTLISIVLGASSVVLEDGTTQTQSFSESKRLLQWGFANFSYRKLVDTKNPVCELPVSLASGASSVVLVPESTLECLMDNDADLSTVQLNISVPSRDSGEELFAPISAGEVLGEAEIIFDGVNYGKVNLVANTTVELDRVKYIAYEIQTTLSNKYVKLVIFALVAIIVLYTAFIIIYNIKRRQKKQAAAELAKKRIEEIMRGESLSSGKSFEEIMEMHEKHDDYLRK